MPARGSRLQPEDVAVSGFILVVDDDAEARRLVVEALERTGYPLREASSGNEAFLVAQAERPTLVVLEVQLPDVTGYEVCRELRDLYGDELAILFVSSTRTEAPDRVAGLLIGADDYVTKPFDRDELLARGRRLLVRAARAPQPTNSRFARLTPREREILLLLADGMGQADIAQRLAISPKTVGTHIQRTLEKLDVRNRAQAVALAHREGLLAENGLADL